MMCMILWPWNSPYLNYLCCATDVEAVETILFLVMTQFLGDLNLSPSQQQADVLCAMLQS